MFQGILISAIQMQLNPIFNFPMKVNDNVFSSSGGGKVIGLEQRQLIGSKLIGQELLSLS